MEQNEKAQNPAEQPQQEPIKVNKKAIIGGAAAIVIIGIIVGVVLLVRHNGAAKADNALSDARMEMNDSLHLDKLKAAADLGYKSGNNAKIEAAILLYQKGEYQEAIKYLDGASVSSGIVEAGKYSLMGDCYVNLNEYDKALSAYHKAISAADDNPEIVPFVLVKEANIYRAQGKYEDEYKAYEKIYKDYPEYTTNADIRKYAERARAAAGK